MFIQIILIALLAVMLSVTVRRARQGVIRWGEAFLWSALWIAAAIMILLPQTTSIIARVAGVGRGVDAIVYLSVTLLFVLVFRAFVLMDKLEQQLTEVTRHQALQAAHHEASSESPTPPAA